MRPLPRSEAISTLWGQLPNDPFAVPPGPFVAWAGMDKAAFDAKLAALKTAQAAYIKAVGQYEMSQGDLHEKDAELADFAVAALTEGRAQFATGTAEAEVIDAIPNAPAAHRRRIRPPLPLPHRPGPIRRTWNTTRRTPPVSMCCTKARPTPPLPSSPTT